MSRPRSQVWHLPSGQRLSERMVVECKPEMREWVRAEAKRVGLSQQAYLRSLIQAEIDKKKGPQ